MTSWHCPLLFVVIQILRTLFLPQFSMHFVSMIPAANRLKFIQWPFLLPLKTIRIVLVIVWIVKNALLQNVLLKKTPAMICDVSIFLAVSALNMESGGSGNLKEYTDCEQIESKWDSSGCKLHFKMKENYRAVCGPPTSHQKFRHIHHTLKYDNTLAYVNISISHCTRVCGSD